MANRGASLRVGGQRPAAAEVFGNRRFFELPSLSPEPATSRHDRSPGSRLGTRSRSLGSASLSPTGPRSAFGGRTGARLASPRSSDGSGSGGGTKGDSPFRKHRKKRRKKPTEYEYAVNLLVQSTKGVRREVHVIRSPTGIGFTLHGARPVMVIAVESGSPAWLAGMQEGDVLLAVDGSDCTNSSHNGVIELMKNALSIPRRIDDLEFPEGRGDGESLVSNSPFTDVFGVSPMPGQEDDVKNPIFQDDEPAVPAITTVTRQHRDGRVSHRVVEVSGNPPKSLEDHLRASAGGAQEVVEQRLVDDQGDGARTEQDSGFSDDPLARIKLERIEAFRRDVEAIRLEGLQADGGASEVETPPTLELDSRPDPNADAAPPPAEDDPGSRQQDQASELSHRTTARHNTGLKAPPAAAATSAASGAQKRLIGAGSDVPEGTAPPAYVEESEDEFEGFEDKADPSSGASDSNDGSSVGSYTIGGRGSGASDDGGSDIEDIIAGAPPSDAGDAGGIEAVPVVVTSVSQLRSINPADALQRIRAAANAPPGAAAPPPRSGRTGSILRKHPGAGAESNKGCKAVKFSPLVSEMPNGVYPIELTEDEYLEAYGPERTAKGFRGGTVAARAALFGGGQPDTPAPAAAPEPVMVTRRHREEVATSLTVKQAEAAIPREKERVRSPYKPISAPARAASISLSPGLNAESATETATDAAASEQQLIERELEMLRAYKPSDPYAYPGTMSVRRADLEHESWDTPEPEYKPVSYTAVSVLAAGPEVADAQTVGAMQFNRSDGGVDRRSTAGTYKVVNKLPLNPRGRTGLAGRGALPRWGPNHCTTSVITRWARGRDGRVSVKSNSQVLEVLVARHETGQWALPMSPAQGPRVLVEAINEALLQHAAEQEADESARSALERRVQDLLAAGSEVFSGTVEDPRNTDNAWVETTGLSYHDDAGALNVFPLEFKSGVHQFKWAVAAGGLSLFGAQRELVGLVTSAKEAYFGHLVPSVDRSFRHRNGVRRLSLPGVPAVEETDTDVDAASQVLNLVRSFHRMASSETQESDEANAVAPNGKRLEPSTSATALSGSPASRRSTVSTGRPCAGVGGAAKGDRLRAATMDPASELPAWQVAVLERQRQKREVKVEDLGAKREQAPASPAAKAPPRQPTGSIASRSAQFAAQEPAAVSAPSWMQKLQKRRSSAAVDVKPRAPEPVKDGEPEWTKRAAEKHARWSNDAM